MKGAQYLGCTHLRSNHAHDGDTNLFRQLRPSDE
jgi:hypothetical protein